jgi:hypothetical protein
MSTAGCVIQGGGEENKRIETSATPPLFDWSDSEDHAATLVTPVHFSLEFLLLTNPHRAPWQSRLHWVFSMRTSRLQGIPIIPGVCGGNFACGMPSTPPMSSGLYLRIFWRVTLLLQL